MAKYTLRNHKIINICVRVKNKTHIGKGIERQTRKIVHFARRGNRLQELLKDYKLHRSKK
jgi:protein-arginine kinase activator protein McsA